MLANGPTRFTMSDPTSFQDAPGMGKLLGFFSTRVLRGGPKILLYLAMFLALILVVIRSMPEGLSDIAFGSISSDIAMGFWAWSQNPAKLGDESAAYGSGKRLRVVVFGADDIAAPAHERGGNRTLGWTEAMCHQLRCSDYQSMIPGIDAAVHPLTSNELYSFALDRALNQTAILGNKPGFDYAFAPDQYPVPKDLPDLSEQVSLFLSKPKPTVAPTETIWVFSVGAWDIWSLAALPLDVSEPMIGDLSHYVFEQIERLYESSLDRESVAWSGNNQVNEPPSKAAVSNNSNMTVPEAPKEMFRILIPKVFDPSLTPGWHAARPMAPEVHSRAEQMRNAARLTDKWNQEVSARLKAWVKLSDPEPAVNSAAGATAGGLATNIVDPFPSHGTNPAPSGTQTPSVATPSATPEPATPLRDGIPYDLPQYILRAITDRQFRDSELEDANGIGKEFETKSFFEVWEPCVNEYADEEDDELDDYDEEDDEDASAVLFASEGLRSNKLPRGTPKIRGRSPKPNYTASLEAEGKEDKAVTTCAVPDDHLFYTAFTVSQRAIAKIANQAAIMVLKNETIRGRMAETRLSA